MRQYYHACSVKSLFGFLIHTETGSSFMYSINWHCLWQRERNKIISINCRNIMLVKQRHLVLSCIWNSKTVFCTSIYYVKSFAFPLPCYWNPSSCILNMRSREKESFINAFCSLHSPLLPRELDFIIQYIELAFKRERQILLFFAPSPPPSCFPV